MAGRLRTTLTDFHRRCRSRLKNPSSRSLLGSQVLPTHPNEPAWRTVIGDVDQGSNEPIVSITPQVPEPAQPSQSIIRSCFACWLYVVLSPCLVFFWVVVLSFFGVCLGRCGNFWTMNIRSSKFVLAWEIFWFFCVLLWLIFFYMDWSFVFIERINFNQSGRENLNWIVLVYFISHIQKKNFFELLKSTELVTWASLSIVGKLRNSLNLWG